MRAFPGRFAALLALALLTACATPAARQPAPVAAPVEALVADLTNPRGAVLVIGHRGCWDAAPENSLPAIEACIGLGVDMVEVDVQRSADGALVLMHDLSVDRTTDGAGAVADLSAAQIARLRLRAGPGGAGQPLTRHTVPTLRQALETARGRILVNIDAKADVYADVSSLLVEMGLAGQVLMKMPAAPDDPRLRASPLMRQAHFMPVIVERAGHGPIAALLPGYDDMAPVAYEIVFENRAYFEAGAGALRGSGRRVWVNTLQPFHAAGHTDPAALADPDAHWGRLVADGVTMIQTDAPGPLIAYLCAKGHRRRCPAQPGP